MGNGWSNDIPNPFVVGGGGLSGEIDIVNSSNQVFIKMTSDGFFLIDPATNQLLAAISPDTVVNPTYGLVYEGVFTYDPLFTDVAAGIMQGELRFSLRNKPNSGDGSLQAFNPGFTSDNPIITLNAPVGNFGSPDWGYIVVAGNSEDLSKGPYIKLAKGSPGDVEVLVCGTLDYTTSSSIVPEPWHRVSYAAGWSDNGGAFGNVAYKRTAFGEVALTGLAKFTGTVAAPSTVFTLPAGYRPNRNVNFVSGTQTNPVSPYAIGITTAGLVTVTQYGGTVNPGPVSFEGLSFYLTGA